MTDSSRKVVLDASALVAWIYRETGYQVVARALPVAVAAVPNVVETLARSAERGYDASGEELFADLQEMGLAVEPVLVEDTLRASELIIESRKLNIASGHGIALGDALCLAVGERLNLPVIGGDKAWDKLDLRTTHRLFRR